MFIELCLTHLFSPAECHKTNARMAFAMIHSVDLVGTECLWTCHWYPHIVPTGLRVRLFRFFYKHIVPTKSTPNTLMAFVGTEMWDSFNLHAY